MGPEMDANDDDQQFCLRWNNFQANITSQFETLRDDEDFTDVTIAVEGQRLQAHKVVLSACSPYFKELFKSNPCSHPIIFMRDVEARHVVALMEFMYAGEVNVAQAHLSSFLKTAESLKIRGLTDTSNDLNQRDDDTLFLNPQPLSTKPNATDTKSRRSALNAAVACSSTVTSSEDVATTDAIAEETTSVPPSKRRCKTDVEDDVLRTEERLTRTEETVCVTNPFELDVDKFGVRPKIELPDYASDEDRDDGGSYFHMNNDLTGGMEIIPQSKLLTAKDLHPETNYGSDSRKLHSLDPRPCEECGRVYSNLSNLRQHMKLIHYPTFVSCPVCAKSFKTDLYLRRHMITTHETTNYRQPRPVGRQVGGCGSHVTAAKAISSNSGGKFGPTKHGYVGL